MSSIYSFLGQIVFQKERSENQLREAQREVQTLNSQLTTTNQQLQHTNNGRTNTMGPILYH